MTTVTPSPASTTRQLANRLEAHTSWLRDWQDDLPAGVHVKVDTYADIFELSWFDHDGSTLTHLSATFGAPSSVDRGQSPRATWHQWQAEGDRPALFVCEFRQVTS